MCGINDELMQKKLLSEKGLTYTRAVEIAQGVETSEANLREIKGPVPIKTEPVYQVQGATRTIPARKTTCSRCGVAGHSESMCRFKDKLCNFCKKKDISLGCVGPDWDNYRLTELRK